MTSSVGPKASHEGDGARDSDADPKAPAGKDDFEQSGEPTLTVDALTRMDPDDLLRCYRAAPRPQDAPGLQGALDGHMLGLSGALGRGLTARLVTKIASMKHFPWSGKTFHAGAEGPGGGVNRVNLLGERTWFHFETRIDASVIDGEPCVVLDYDQADNPWPVRQVRDELRAVAPGLWAGPALVRGHVALFFAVTEP